MRQLVSLLSIFVLAAAITGCTKEEVDKSAKFYSLVGDVKIVSGGQEKAAAVGVVLAAGDAVKTGADSIADLLLGDAGIIRIQPGSNVSMSSLMDPVTGDTRLDMPQGTVTVTLSKLKKGTFSVKTPTAVASVRGTTFRVSADQKAARLDVVTGTVTVNPVKDNAIVPTVEKTVETNQTVVLDEKTVKEAVERKKEIKVAELKPEEIKKIKDEVKDIKPEVLEKLNSEARQEIKEKILPPSDSVDREKEEKALKKQGQAQNLPRSMKAAEEKAPEQAQPAKPAAESKQKEKAKDSKGNPAGLQFL